MKTHDIPCPLFDTLTSVQALYKTCQMGNTKTAIDQWLTCCLPDTSLPDYAITDYQHTLNFLYSYRGSLDTFNAYRRELERLLQWCWFVHKQSVTTLKRLDIEAFIEFCQRPDKSWVGVKTLARFIEVDGQRIPNQQWRPFIVKVSKKAYQEGNRAKPDDFEFSQQAIKALFAVLSSFYNYLIQEEATEINPLLQIRQKSKFIRKTQAHIIRRLSDIQWQTVIKTAQTMADINRQNERTLFIMNALYGMYLRISELAASNRWTPVMCDFFRDANNNWWFKTVGKGNKERQIAVSNDMLNALRRWRESLALTALPAPDDQSPLIPKQRGKGPMSSTRAIRNIVQTCFDQAVTQLITDNLADEAEMLRSATVHWLRHTGISDDVKQRPREHVRDDAGHSSSAITDKYIDVELQERAKSAKHKVIITETTKDVV